jgi:hypothetical protein
MIQSKKKGVKAQSFDISSCPVKQNNPLTIAANGLHKEVADGIRTRDTQSHNLVLYPTELQPP